jgi:hypothetical protein
MTIAQAKELHRGDEIYWRSPDRKRAGYYIILSIQIKGNVATIIDTMANVFECPVEELS